MESNEEKNIHTTLEVLGEAMTGQLTKRFQDKAVLVNSRYLFFKPQFSNFIDTDYSMKVHVNAELALDTQDLSSMVYSILVRPGYAGLNINEVSPEKLQSTLVSLEESAKNKYVTATGKLFLFEQEVRPQTEEEEDITTQLENLTPREPVPYEWKEESVTPEALEFIITELAEEEAKEIRDAQYKEKLLSLDYAKENKSGKNFVYLTTKLSYFTALIATLEKDGQSWDLDSSTKAIHLETLWEIYGEETVVYLGDEEAEMMVGSLEDAIYKEYDIIKFELAEEA